jgi:tetratricopeptide (TPR) repeat protein
MFLFVRKYSKACDIFQQAQHIAMEENDLASQGNYLHNLATAYQNNRQLDRALFAYEQSFDLATRTKDNFKRVLRLNGVGVCHLKTKAYDKSFQCFTKAMEMAKGTSLNDLKLETTILMNMGATIAAKSHNNDDLFK